jgi:hypothetical protein
VNTRANRERAEADLSEQTIILRQFCYTASQGQIVYPAVNSLEAASSRADSPMPGNVILCRPIIYSAAVFGVNGTSFRRVPRPPLSHLSSFRTYRGRAIADINGDPQSISPKSGSGYLPGGVGPPMLRPAHLFKSAELSMAAGGAEHDADRKGFPSNHSRPGARG